MIYNSNFRSFFANKLKVIDCAYLFYQIFVKKILKSRIVYNLID